MGILFNGLLEFESHEELNKLFDSNDRKMALKLIELALQHAQNNGLYTFQESHVVYNCLNILKKET
jgi:hypothetical protein